MEALQRCPIASSCVDHVFSNAQSIEVKLELGHRALLRVRPTTEGFTHDWTVFVRGPEGCNIQHFVDKVVFFLHESFPKPKRGEIRRQRCRTPA